MDTIKNALFGILIRPEGNQLETHVLSGIDKYQSFLLHTEIPLYKASGQWWFMSGDANGDGGQDIIGVLAKTDSDQLEVHVLSGADKYQSFLLQTPIPLYKTSGRWQFVVGDWNRNGRQDIIGILTKPDSDQLEMHVLSGADKYQSFLLQASIPLYKTSGHWQFAAGSWADSLNIVGILAKDDSNQLEVHVLSGSSQYQSFLLQTLVPLYKASGYWQFAVGNGNGDGEQDIVGALIKTDVNQLEVHVLSGADKYQSFVLQSLIPLYAASGQWQLFQGQVSRARFEVPTEKLPQQAGSLKMIEALNLIDDGIGNANNGDMFGKVGERRVQVKRFNPRIEHTRDPIIVNELYQADPGWVVTTVDITFHGQKGNILEHLHWEKLQPGKTHFYESTQKAIKELIDFLYENEAKAGQEELSRKLKARLEADSKRLWEANRDLAVSNTTIAFKGRAECRYIDVFVGTIYESGAEFDATARIHEMYLGDDTFLADREQKYKQALQVLNEKSK